MKDTLLFDLVLLLTVIVIITNVIYPAIKTINSNIRVHKELKKTIRFVDQEDINSFIISLSNALARMSTDCVGALIVMENKNDLQKYIDVGKKVDCPFSSELAYTIFYNHSSPLHDGAMIIRNWRIASLSSYLPITKRLLDVKYGARHRAAYGISEYSDAFVFVVSETTGTILFLCRDEHKILSTSPTELAKQIYEIFNNYNVIRDTKKKNKRFASF